MLPATVIRSERPSKRGSALGFVISDLQSEKLGKAFPSPQGTITPSLMGVWQEQAVQLIEDGAGMTAGEADEVRRTFARPNNDHLIACTGGGSWMARGGTLS